MANIHSFAADYSEARDKFLAAARVAGATTYRYDNPDQGPERRSPVDRCGAAGPRRCLEGRRDDLQHARRRGLLRLGLPGRLAGERRRRRPAEGHGGGVRPRHQSLRLCLDAARDGGGQRPQPQLRRPQQALSGERGLSRDRRLPGAEGPRARPTVEAAEAKLAAYRKKVGDIAYFRAVSGGQYSHPDGMFFGGGGPSWSNRTLHAITDRS